MSTLTRIAEAFAALKTQGRMAFMPFVTAGDPDLETTLALVRTLAGSGVDLIEVGFPYSDPIADGPVVQASYTRALARHVHVEEIFAAFERLASEGRGSKPEDRGPKDSTLDPRPSTIGLPPLVAMVSFAIIFRVGTERFVLRAKQAGFSGLIVPDLPGDEAADLAALTKSQGLDLVQLVAPTTPPQRVERILRSASGFVYCISVAGTTGIRDELPPELREQLRWLRTKTDLPLAVGFGISRPEQVGTLRGFADGVIVGSAIVRRLEALSTGSGNRADVLADVGRFAAQMVEATRS